MPRKTQVKVAAHESPRLQPPGWSPLAIQARKTWDAADRPAGWAKKPYGLVVHTTGRGLPTKAQKIREYPTKTAVDYYSRSHGCHYVIGYGGVERGDLLQLAAEQEQANGVGTGDQRDLIYVHAWEKNLPAALVKRWKARWPGYANPLDLLPGTRTANSPYIHVECIPLTPYFVTGVDVPMREKMLFTEEQHATIALLAIDIAERNEWDRQWWKTPRLVGHEDLTPCSRHDKRGGWDPGWLRATPYMDMGYIESLIAHRVTGEALKEHGPKNTKTRRGGPYAKY